ncbi:MAG: SusC/RagA family TonB-linked outer membrane protein [Bacteroidales bacterium]|nr:SusC/RagA family TonB-linked outer membrane protein [Bacteroidales bacterium]
MKKYASVLIAILMTYLSLYAQEPNAIKGSVVDYLSSTPIANVNISIQGVAGVNTESAKDGTFKIKTPSKYSVLVASVPGYQVKEYPLFGKSEVTIALIPEGLQLGESKVRLPYEVINEKNLNGAYSVIAKEYDKTVQYRDIFQMLEGNVAGLEMNAYSGVPGEGSKLNLRGVHSLYAGNDPLLVIDGVPVVNQNFTNSVAKGSIYNYLADINVKDIESITVLRDASAVGIYGTRASNGAIVVSTKEGTHGKTYLDISIQRGISLRSKEMPMMNSSEYLSYLSDRLNRQGLTEDTIEARYPFFGNINTNSVEYWTYANQTNWQKETTRIAPTQDYYLHLRGGDVTSKYSLNVGYVGMEGVGKGISDDRLTSRFNLDFRISPKLSAGMRIAFSRTTKNLMDQGNEERTNLLYLSLVKPTIFSPYQKSAQGVSGPFLTQPGFDLLSNPVAVYSGVTNEVVNTWLMANVFAQFEFSKNLKTKLAINIDRKGLDEDRFTPANGIVPDYYDLRFDRTSEEQQIVDMMMRVEHTLTYSKKLNEENRLTALLGYNFELSEYKRNYGYTIHSTSDEFQGLNDGTKLDMFTLREDIHNMSLFANADYAFREKIFLKGGVRVDGSSRFGDQVEADLHIGSVPLAVLPYAGLTWKVKAEPWFRSMSFLDDLNIRASWGLTANQNIPVNARYSLYTKSFYGDYSGFGPFALGNSAIKWETTNNYNVGLDLSVLKKSLGVRLDYFINKTTDLLLPGVTSGSSGFNTTWTNAGSIENRGFELGINTFGHAGDFLWKFDFNIAKSVSKVNDLPSGLPIIDGTNDEYTSIARNGQEAGLIYGYKCYGVFRYAAQVNGLLNDQGFSYHAGDYHYADLVNDGIINEKDMTVIGNPNPDFFGGFTANLTYKNFALDAAFTYSYGNDILNVLRMKLETGSGYENQSVTVLNRWMKNGDLTSIPNTELGSQGVNRKPSTNYIEDGSYLKMKSLTLSYNIKKKMNFIRNAQIYVSGYNLFTLTKYLGWDPEVAIGQSVFTRGYDFGNYPMPRMLMLGVKFSL